MKRIYSLLLGGCFLSMGMLSCESQKPMDPAGYVSKG
jgi:hypothetical protein